MEDIFKGFYNPNEQALNKAWSSGDSLFIFDTNVFLNLYSYAEQTRKDFFNVLEKINNRVWIPYHVGLEYQFRRLKIIKNEKLVFDDLRRSLDKIEHIFDEDVKKLSLEKRYPELHKNTDKLHNDVVKIITAYKEIVSYWDDKQPCVRSHDPIRDKINKIFKGKVGDPPISQEELDELYEDGAKRYENKIPPGYKDDNKKDQDEPYLFYNSLKYERRFGDLIIWKQIINKAKSEKVKKVIFITDDSKEDWWYIIDSRGKKIIGPHAYLQAEIFEKAKIDLFFMYNTSSFLEYGKTNLEIGVHASSIEDAESRFWETKNSSNLIDKKNIENLLLDEEYSSRINDIDSYEILREIYKNENQYENELKKINRYYVDKKSILDEDDFKEAFIKNLESKSIKEWLFNNDLTFNTSKLSNLQKEILFDYYLKRKKDDEK